MLFYGGLSLSTYPRKDITKAFCQYNLNGIESIDNYYWYSKYPKEYSNKFVCGIDLNIGVNKHIYPGIFWHLSNYEEIHGKNSSEELLQAYFFGVSCDYIINPVDKYLLRRGEFGICTGVSYCRIYTYLHFYDTQEYWINTFGVHLNLHYDLYLTSYMSLNINTGTRIVPPVTVKPKKLDPHKVNFTGFHTALGLRFHI